MNDILVYVQNDNGFVPDFSYDLVSYAREISNGKEVLAVIIKGEENISFENLQKYGADKVCVLKTDSVDFDKRKNPYLIVELIKKIQSDIFLLDSTTEGREIAPVVASSLNTGLTADCTKVEIVDNKLLSTRPTFGGKLMASILCKNKPEMATVRIGSFKKKEFEKRADFEVLEFDFLNEIQNAPNLKLEITDFKKDCSKAFSNLQNAKIVLAGGMGLKNKENFEKLKHLADLMGAVAAGSRKAVDKGFIEREVQIGQTGNSVAPEIYIAFGISGAIHHIMGMENSKKIIAVNTDKNAPIFKHSDIGIIEDAAFVLDYLIGICNN